MNCLTTVRRIPLGNTTEALFPIGQGTNGFGSRINHDPAAVRDRQEAISAGIDNGITFIDTAELYGSGFSEECLAPIIGQRRREVFLATKFSSKVQNTRVELRRSVENSLRRLQTDHVDLLQVHYPNPEIRENELFAGMKEMVTEGKARYLGTSNFSVPELTRAQAALGNCFVSNQVEYNPYDRSAETEVIPWAIEHSITIFAYSPLGHGTLALPEASLDPLTVLAERLDCTVHQLVLAWVIRYKNVVALTKTANLSHQSDNVFAASLPITSEELQQLDKLLNIPWEYRLPASIAPDSGKGRPTYVTVEEAVQNELRLEPSPVDLAKLMKAGHAPKPIRLQLATRPEGKHLLQPFDHFGELRKYWAWILVHGWNTPMPSIIFS